MPYIGNQIALEDTQDRKAYTGDGSRTVFGITFSDSLVQVYQNGILLKETNDYTLDSGGTFVTFVVAPEAGDSIDLIGTTEITDLARNSFSKENITATSGQQHFTLTSNITGSDRLSVFLNGIRLHESDYVLTHSNNTITFSSGRVVGDILTAEIMSPGFRSPLHNQKNEKATHTAFASPSTLNTDVFVPSDENVMLIGPITVNGDIIVDGTLTVV